MIGKTWTCLIILGVVSQHRTKYTGTIIPKLLSKNQSYEVLKGSNQVLECRVKNLGKFVVLWRKGDRILSAGKLLVRKDGKVTVTEKYELKLSDIEESDAGEYVCEVDVFGETKEVRHQMNVLVAPVITSWERTLEVSAGDDLTIICEATGNPPPKITWKKHQDGKVIIPDETGSKVVLKNLSRRDAGLYICTANNQVNEGVEKVTKITVKYPPEVTIEEVWVPHKTTFEVRLVCHVSSYPTSKVTWFKNENTKLSTSDEILIEDQEPKHVLKIENLKVKNFGKYKCKASNALGHSEDTITITGKPRPPIFSGDQREILSSVKELNITWSTDSISPVTQYLLFYRKSETGIILSSPSSSNAASKPWLQSIIPVEVPNASLTSFASYTLKNLDNETVYDVRVKAMNAFGMSKFSKVFNFYVKTSVGTESDIAPRSLQTEAKEVIGSGTSRISTISTTLILTMLMFLSESVS